MMRESTFNRIRDIVYDMAGIALSDRKEALVCARVSRRVRALGLSDYETYLTYLEKNPDEAVGLLNSISTNVTSFFREPHHFEFIADELERWYQGGQRRFRFWSAACSTGEEPYSLGMVIRESLPFPDVDARILATDISTEALASCETAHYASRHMAPVPLHLRKRWFVEHKSQLEKTWAAKKQLHNMVVSRRLNLSAPPFPMRGPFDTVFCRNVMIYFDDPVRLRLLDEIHRLLKPGGYLIVGHAESLVGIIGDFKYVRPSVYRRV